MGPEDWWSHTMTFLSLDPDTMAPDDGREELREGWDGRKARGATKSV